MFLHERNQQGRKNSFRKMKMIVNSAGRSPKNPRAVNPGRAARVTVASAGAAMNYWILFGLLLLPFCGQGQVDTQSEKIVLPLSIVQGRPVFELLIAGQGPFRFVFDTGKMGREITTDQMVASRFDFKKVDSLVMGDPTGRNVLELPVVIIPALSVGHLTLSHVRAAINPRSLPGINGVAGLSLFGDYLVTLDLGSQRLVLEKGELGPVDGQQILAYESMRGIPKVKIRIGNEGTEAVLDSGNSRTDISVPKLLAGRITFSGPVMAAGLARTMFNQMEIQQAKIKGNLEIGTNIFAQPMISFPAFGEEADLGGGFLKHFSLTFDQKNHRVRFVRID